MSVVGEPYPALMLPGFGTVPAESDGSARFEQGAFVAELEDGTQVVYSSGEIFDAMPLGHRVPVMSHFHPRSFEPVDESSPSRSRALRRRLLPLFWPSPSSPEALAARGARADWVFGRVEALAGRRAERVVVRWTMERRGPGVRDAEILAEIPLERTAR